MGLFSGIILLETVRQRQISLESKLLTAQETLNQVSNYAHELVTIGDELDPESPEYKKLTERRKKLDAMEKRLQSEIDRYRTQLKIAEGQTQLYEQLVDGAIKHLIGGGGR